MREMEYTRLYRHTFFPALRVGNGRWWEVRANSAFLYGERRILAGFLCLAEEI
jgi:hypothetical protein